MDIRNFFGGNKGNLFGINKKENVAKLSNKRNIIKDDEDDTNDNIAAQIEEKPELNKTETMNSKEKIENIAIVSNETKKLAKFSSKRRIVKDDEDDTNANIGFQLLDKSELNKTETIDSTDKIQNVTMLSNKEAETAKKSCQLVSSIPKDVADFITWKKGESIPYSVLVDTFENIFKVSGRLDKERLFCKLFQSAILTTPSDLSSLIFLASNSVSPAYEGLELGIGDSLLVKAICEATGRKKDSVEEAYEREGDLGTVALISRASQTTLSFAAKPKPLASSFVLDQLRAITQIKGDKSQGRKVSIIKSLMIKCLGNEAKFIVRALQGKLRIGTAAQTVLVALAQAFVHAPTYRSDGTMEDAEENDEEAAKTVGKIPSVYQPMSVATHGSERLEQLLAELRDFEPPEARELRRDHSRAAAGSKRATGLLDIGQKCGLAENAVKRAFSECPNLNLLVTALLQQPLHLLYRECRLIPGVPVHPMLAKPTKQIQEVMKRLSGQSFTMEYKYDGERAQLHLRKDGSIKIFSRNSEDNTEKYPDLMEVLRSCRNGVVTSCVVDAEVVAYDREKGCLMPFQVLSTRKRKVEDGDEDQKVKVVLQLFDLLYINERSLLQYPLRVRREILHNSFTEREGLLHFAKGSDHVEDGDTAPIESFMNEAVAAMCEGLMVKTLDDNASYEPSRRSQNWLKLKKDYIDGMGVCDSVDLVVIGGYRGKGKRVNVYGAYLMACYDVDRDEFQSVCKVGTGFKDEDLQRFTTELQQLIIPSAKKPLNYNVSDSLFPDDWFHPSVLWELQAADLSKSSTHRGAVGRVGEAGRGIGLRFPRYIRERKDKKAEMATSAEQIAEMYFSQGDLDNAAVDDDDDDLI